MRLGLEMSIDNGSEAMLRMVLWKAHAARFGIIYMKLEIDIGSEARP